MSRALSESLGWLKRQALAYLAIVAILLVGSWLFHEYQRASVLSSRAEAAAAVVREREAALAQAERSVALADQALAAEAAVLRRARDAARARLQDKERERDAHRARYWPWAGLHGAEALLQGRLLDEEVAALRQAERLAQERLDAAGALQSSAAGLQRMHEAARAKRAEADRLRAQWRRLSAAHPFAQRFPWMPVAAELDRLKQQVEQLQQEAVQAERVLAAAARSRELAEWLRQRSGQEAAQAALRDARAEQGAIAAALERNRYNRLRGAATEFFADKARVFWTALLVLLAAIFSRLLVKLLLYYVLAPLASRRPPLRLLGPFAPRAFAQPVAAGRSGRISDESVTLQLGPDEELLVRPECLQSFSERSAKRTAWLLNPALPLTSILSGLYLLTRVRCEAPEAVVLSAARDPLAEVCLVELPPGAALVCHPRALAGVVQPRGQRVRVTRHWRLGSLHAWLTLQLRFLVFHGPCRLVLQGTRGVRMEPAGGGRLVNQAATLGFDASVPYSNVRSETFVPYWLGREELFNDRFGGIDGSFLYEERPLDRRGNALFGRGLQGLADGVLKVFGI